tara:strand:- start:878 stop:1168 length:291 start_codon:yes stop_codon:yes gene_type:complete
MASNKKLSEIIKKITDQISGDIKDVDEDLVPHFTIIGEGESYFFSFLDKCFIKITRGLQVYIVAENFDISGRSLVYTFSHELILIDPDELQYIGFN